MVPVPKAHYGLKGNAVQSGNSSRCCKFRIKVIPSSATVTYGKARTNRNESEDLPLLSECSPAVKWGCTEDICF